MKAFGDERTGSHEDYLQSWSCRKGFWNVHHVFSAHKGFSEPREPEEKCSRNDVP